MVSKIKKQLIIFLYFVILLVIMAPQGQAKSKNAIFELSSEDSFVDIEYSDKDHKVAQGFTRVTSNSGKNYYMCAFSSLSDKNTYIYIYKTNGTLMAIVRDYGFHHINSIAYGDGKIYIVDGEKYNKIFVLKNTYIDDAIEKASKNKNLCVDKKFTYKYITKVKTKNKYQFLAYDQSSNILYGAILKDKTKLKIYKVYDSTKEKLEEKLYMKYNPDNMYKKDKYFGQLAGLSIKNGYLYIGRNYYCCQAIQNDEIISKNNAINIDGKLYSKIIDKINLKTKKYDSNILISTDIKDNVNELEGIFVNGSQIILFENSQIGVTGDIIGRLYRIELE